MDGTLTIAVHDFNSIKKELGIPLDLDILQAIDQLSPEEAKIVKLKLHEIEFELASKSQASPGTEILLNELRANNHYLGILTRNNFINTKETLKASKLKRYFSDNNIITRDQALPKPNPDGILILLDKWKASPNDAVMVGDYIFDLDAGKQAGLDTIYIDPTEEFKFRKHAKFCIKQLNDILKL